MTFFFSQTFCDLVKSLISSIVRGLTSSICLHIFFNLAFQILGYYFSLHPGYFWLRCVKLHGLPKDESPVVSLTGLEFVEGATVSVMDL